MVEEMIERILDFIAGFMAGAIIAAITAIWLWLIKEEFAVGVMFSVPVIFTWMIMRIQDRWGEK